MLRADFFLLNICYVLKLWYISGMVSAIRAACSSNNDSGGRINVADKRDIRRIKKRLTIRFGIDDAARVAFTEDISMTGLFIKTPNVIPPNSKIRIEIDLPDRPLVSLEARVMWAKKVPANLFHLVKKSGMGVRFLRFHSGEEAFDDFFESIAVPPS
jgi:Tfp pilus assembly protein PilZ